MFRHDPCREIHCNARPVGRIFTPSSAFNGAVPAERFKESAYDADRAGDEAADGQSEPATDGHKACLETVEGVFGGRRGPTMDHAMLAKLYGEEAGSKGHEKKYSPSECVGTRKRTFEGRPKDEDISTSYVERSNLTMRKGMRRCARLTNAFSKKLENHAHMCAQFFCTTISCAFTRHCVSRQR